MPVCTECGKEFKTKRGLDTHNLKCKPTEVEEKVVPQIKDRPTLDIDNVQRKINKLKDARNSCYDAEARYKFEQEIKELEKSL